MDIEKMEQILTKYLENVDVNVLKNIVKEIEKEENEFNIVLEKDNNFGNYKDKYYDDTYFPRNKTFDVKEYQIDLSRKEN